MTISYSIYPSCYSIDWTESVQSTKLSFLFPLDDHANPGAESIRTLFAPSAGAVYVYHPSKRRRTLNNAIDRLETSTLPGFGYVISYIYDKYRRNHSVTSLSQTGQTLHAFLSFFKGLGRTDIQDIKRQDIADYVEHEQERGLKANSVRNHLHTVYAFLRYLVDNDVLPADPRGLTHYDHKDGETKKKTGCCTRPPSLRYSSRRSGRSSALPYPPDEYRNNSYWLLPRQGKADLGLRFSETFLTELF